MTICRPKRQPPTPALLSIIAAWFLVSGSFFLVATIILAIVGRWIFANTYNLDIPNLIPFFGEFLLTIGIIGVLISGLTIAAGIGITTAKRWGLWYGYVIAVLWLFLSIWPVIELAKSGFPKSAFDFLATYPLVLIINLLSPMISVSTIVYFSRPAVRQYITSRSRQD
jgi:hypothetical protein